MNCIICKNKDGKNLNTGTSELKYHLSVCVYGTGGFLKYLPHGQACGPEEWKFSIKISFRASSPITGMETEFFFICNIGWIDRSGGIWKQVQV